MRKSLLSALLLTGIMFIADAQINTPIPSPAGSVSSTVGLTDIKIDYFRPGVKGRKIFGTGDQFLEQYGVVWRTGANSGSVVSFSTDLKIGGQDVKAGDYQIVSRPGKDEWEVMFITEMIGGNMTNFNEDIVAAKVTVKPIETAWTVERLTFQIANISEDNSSADIQFAWANVMWNVPVTVDFDEAVMKEIAEKTQVNPGNYIQAANYYFAAGKDLNQALEWVNAYLAVGNNSAQFWNVHLKAQILAKLGMKKEAIATAEDSMAKAKARGEGNDFGYVKRNEDLIKEVKGK